MAYRGGYRDPCTWNVARLSEIVKNTRLRLVLLRFPKVLQHHAMLQGKPFGIPLIHVKKILVTRCW